MHCWDLQENEVAHYNEGRNKENVFFPSFYHALVKFEYFAMGFEFYLGIYVKTF